MAGPPGIHQGIVLTYEVIDRDIHQRLIQDNANLFQMTVGPLCSESPCDLFLRSLAVAGKCRGVIRVFLICAFIRPLQAE